ncbi:MAG: glutathione S-transferase family protein [Hyphomicrobiaceae bacterium]|nr:glutathione S-transferase family protein [Hyphomicrobiaceae bacterium]
MSNRLYDWAPSPFSLKVRAILNYKGIAYERASVLQVRNLLALRRGGVGKAPALEVDGRMIVDSTDIAYALERLAPSPSILPQEARQRALCHALEEWADESLYFVGLYFHWHDPEGRRQVPQVFGRSLAGRAMFRFYLRRMLRQLEGQGTARKTPGHVREDAVRQLGAAEDLTRGDGFLLGERPYLCDFALAGQLVYLGRSPVGATLLAQRPGIAAYLDRMKLLARGAAAAA